MIKARMSAASSNDVAEIHVRCGIAGLVDE
jgi:hypothetical protein